MRDVVQQVGWGAFLSTPVQPPALSSLLVEGHKATLGSHFEPPCPSITHISGILFRKHLWHFMGSPGSCAESGAPSCPRPQLQWPREMTVPASPPLSPTNASLLQRDSLLTFESLKSWPITPLRTNSSFAAFALVSLHSGNTWLWGQT